MRKIMTLALAGIVAFGVVSIAAADESVQVQSQTVKPGKISKKKHQDVKYTNLITTSDVPGTQQPPKAVRTVVDYPKNFKFNNKNAPTCKTDADGLGAAPTVEAAKEACGSKSAVSVDKNSFAEIRVDSDILGAFAVPVEVVAFNGKKNTLYLYSLPGGAGAGLPPSILEGKLRKSTAGKKYDRALDVTIPSLAAGAISIFQVQIPKAKVAKITKKKKNGKKKKTKVAYVQAKCKPSKFTLQATTTFDDGSKTSDTHTTKCKPKK